MGNKPRPTGRVKPKPIFRAEARRQMQRRLALAAAAVVGVAALVLVVASTGDDGDVTSGGETAAPQGTVTVEVAAAEHVRGSVDYELDPPAGGDHNAIWQNCGFYRDPIIPELAVHSMEHGAVWITHAPDLPEDQVQRLQELAQQSYVLVSPYERLDEPVVASAWGRQLRVDDADDERLDQFVRAFRQGEQAPEPGAPCTGGEGEPQ